MYIASQDLSSNRIFVPFNPLQPFHPLPHPNSGKHQPVLCIYDGRSCLFILPFVFVFIFLFLETTYKWGCKLFIVLWLTFHLAWYLGGPSMLSKMTKFHSFLWLKNNMSILQLLYPFFHWWTPNFFSVAWLLQMMPLWICRCTYLSQLVILFSSYKYPEVELLDHVVVILLIFLRKLYYFP